MKNHRLLLLMEQRFQRELSWHGKLSFLWKKYAYIGTISLAKGMKRLFDVLVSFFAMLFFLPFGLLIALAIVCTDRGPPIYISRRVGKYGKRFAFYKFRSMRLYADKIRETLLSSNKHGNSVTFKLANDPRVTWIGSIIRKTSLDELPQLWNVLKGDMSLVGPRPALPEEVAKYSLEERSRLDITPGITGLWQVSGRADLNFVQQVELDVAYIKSENVFADIIILLKTIPAVIFGKGAY